MIKHLKMKCVVAICVAAQVATLACAAESAAARAEVVSLDGTWQAEVALDAQGETLPTAFTRTIPVPGHWPLMKPSAPCGKTEALWCRTTWKASAEIPPRATLRIGMASFGTTIFVNGKKAGFFPYNFVPSETDIRPFLRPGAENEIVVRLGNAWTQNAKGAPMAHTGKDNERFNYYPGITDSVKLFLSDWPAIKRLETAADLEKGIVNVRATVTNGASKAVSAKLAANVGCDAVEVPGADLAPGEEREIVFSVPLSGFDRDRDTWTPENPVLMVLTARTAGDEMTRRFGMRTFDVNPRTRRFRLNGRDRMLFGTNTDLFRFYDDPQCGTKPWDREWMRAFFAQIKSIGWDSFRQCISAPPDFWYDLCDEMGLLIQDEYPYCRCGNDGSKSPFCACDDKTLFPELLAWVRARGTHPSVAIIDLQNESFKYPWFDALAHALAPYDFQKRPIETGWEPNTIPDSPIECHPYLFCSREFSLGYLNLDISDNFYRINAMGPGNGKKLLRADIASRPVIINEYGWHWLNRLGDPTRLGKGNYDFLMPRATREERKEYYAWSFGVLTEYWRATRRAAAILHFTALTYGFNDPNMAYTGDILAPDLTTPRIRPEIVYPFHSAFAPVALVIDEYREDVIPGTERSFDIILLNDSRDGQAVTRKVILRVDGIAFETFKMSAPYGGEGRRRVTVRVPSDAKGTIKVRASFPDGTCSERRWKVLDRKPGLEAGARASASSELSIRPVQYLLDGSPLTRWESAPGDKKPWVEIDLGEERDVTSCKIHWFRVWKKPPAKWRVTPALPARTRYIFVEISDISPNKLASIEEIEIH